MSNRFKAAESNYNKLLQELDRWAPVASVAKTTLPPGLSLAMSPDKCCESCVFFTFQFGSAFLGKGRCQNFQYAVQPVQTCDEHSPSPTFV